MALNTFDCFIPLLLVSLLVLSCPILSSALVVTSWSIHLGELKGQVSASQPCSPKPSPGFPFLCFTPETPSPALSYLGLYPCYVAISTCLSSFLSDLCPSVSQFNPSGSLSLSLPISSNVCWMNEWLIECMPLLPQFSHPTSVSMNLSFDLWRPYFHRLHLKRRIICCHERQRKESLVVVIWLSHLPPRPHPHLSPPASSQPPEQQQRVRAVSPPQEGAFSGSSQDLRLRSFGAGRGWRGGLAAERPAPGWGCASEIRAVRGDSRGSRVEGRRGPAPSSSTSSSPSGSRGCSSKQRGEPAWRQEAGYSALFLTTYINPQTPKDISSPPHIWEHQPEDLRVPRIILPSYW